jgi:hypothetical protein
MAAQKMLYVSITFSGVSGDPRNKSYKRIFHKHGGELIGADTLVLSRKGKRDLQYVVPEEAVPALCAELMAAADVGGGVAR